MGGFSFSSVPRPGAPLSLRRRAGRPFFDLFGVPLVTGHHIDLIAFDIPRQHTWLRLAGKDALSQLLCHALHVVFVQVQFVGNLAIREVQAHQVKTTYPDSERLMASRKDGLAQVVKVALAAATTVILALWLPGILALFGHTGRAAVRTLHAVRPAQSAQRFVALGIIEQPCQRDHNLYSQSLAFLFSARHNTPLSLASLQFWQQAETQ